MKNFILKQLIKFNMIQHPRYSNILEYRGFFDLDNTTNI